MKSKMLALLNHLFIFGLLLFLSGCGGSGGGSAATGTGAIAVKITSQGEPVKASDYAWSGSTNYMYKSTIDLPGVVTVRLSISGPGMATITQDFPVSVGKGIIEGVPVGTERLLKILGIDVNGIIISSAEVKNIIVQEGQTSDVGTVILVPVGSYTISGKITVNGAGLAGATVTTGGYSATTMTDGSYAITGVSNGSHTLTVTRSGYSFSPSSIPVLINNASVTGQNFTATQNTFSIKGQVTENGTGLSGVTVSVGSYSTTTQSDGVYLINGVPAGSYNLTASKSGYNFTPASIQITGDSADVTNQNFTATLIPTSFDISGAITINGSGLAGVTVTVGNYSATTLANGSYTITGVPNGSYTLIPSKSGYTFSPATIPVTVNSTNVTGQNFIATATTYSISGKITLDGSGLSGVTVTASNTTVASAAVKKSVSYSATTERDGTYTISGVPKGNYTLTPTKSGYSFSPDSSSITVSDRDATGQNFLATVTTYSIQGSITHSGYPQAGVTVSAGIYSTTTQSDGTYCITGVPNGSYTVTPSKEYYTFSPVSHSVIVNDSDVTGQNFTSTSAYTYSISGSVTYNASPLSGVTVTASPGSYHATTQANGTYTISGLSNGSYIVTPYKSGYFFSPPDHMATINNANAAGIDFFAYY